MALARLVLEFDESKAQIESLIDMADDLEGVMAWSQYFRSLGLGVHEALVDVLMGAVRAYGVITFTNAPTAAQACTVLNVTVTAVLNNATPGNNEFKIGSDAGTAAANFAAAINASTSLAGKVTAAALLGVVTITAVAPGLMGNGLALSAGNLSNASATAFANGLDGDSFQLDRR